MPDFEQQKVPEQRHDAINLGLPGLTGPAQLANDALQADPKLIRAREFASFLETWLPKSHPELFRGQLTVEPLNQGSVNVALAARDASGKEYVVRVNCGEDVGGFQHQGQRWSQYEKEQYWQNVIRESAPALRPFIPTVESVDYISADSLPERLRGEARAKGSIAVSIQTKMPGAGASNWSEGQKAAALEFLGFAASQINSIPAPGAGSRFDPDSCEFYADKRWPPQPMSALVAWRLAAARQTLEDLTRDETLSSDDAARIAHMFDEYEHADLSPRLVRGDLNEGCVLLDPVSSKVTGLFDFETIRSAPGIYEELADRYAAFTAQEFEAFTRGYSRGLGVSIDEFDAQHLAHTQAAAAVQELVNIHVGQTDRRANLSRLCERIRSHERAGARPLSGHTCATTGHLTTSSSRRLGTASENVLEPLPRLPPLSSPFRQR